MVKSVLVLCCTWEGVIKLAIESVEARIRSYTDEQLNSIRKRLSIQIFRLASSIFTPDIFSSQLRYISTLSKVAGGRGLMDEEATPEDFDTLRRARGGIHRFIVLDSLGVKFKREAERKLSVGF